jgi:succinate dehydrogenase hydrophobic anchor subunit
MRNDHQKTVKIRYGIYPLILNSLTGFICLFLFSKLLYSLLIIGFVVMPVLIATYFRPFIMIVNGDIRIVSLGFNHIYTSIKATELKERLPGLKWIIRKDDFKILATYCVDKD